MYFTYSQNNSGGTFVVDTDAGINRHVIIRAESAEKANGFAQLIGIYFDGVEQGIDCSCCGDRWFRADDYEGCACAEIYGVPAQDYLGHVCVHVFEHCIEVI